MRFSSGSKAPKPVLQNAGSGRAAARWLRSWWLRSFGWRRELPTLGRELQACADSLARHAAATEPGFLALGNDLQSLYRAATELTRTLEESNTRLHRELAAQRLSGTDGVVAATLAEVRTGVQAVEALLARSRAITTDLAAMRPQLDVVNRVGVLLQSVAVGFAVESARDKESQVAFGSFVEEIRGLSRRITEVEGRIGEQLAGACDAENSALSLIATELADLSGLAQQLTETSARAAADVQSRLNDIVAAVESMRDRSLRIRQHTEEAVFHMQFGDIVRQKIEHMVEAIGTAAEVLAGGGAARRGELPGVVRSLAVQVAQLEAVERELATAEQQLEHSFSQIAEAATALGDSPEGAATSRAGVVELRGLLADFDRLRELVVMEQRLREQSFVSGQEAFATAARIAGQMKEVETINREMHLLALNAIVMTAALGEAGATLEVLSMQVHDLYRGADEAVGTIGSEAERLVNHRQSADSADLAKLEADRTLVEVVGKVVAGVAEYERTVERIGARVADSNALLEAARGRLARLGEFAQHIRDWREILGAVRGRLEAMLGSAALAAAGEEAASAERYTMESEREIHRRVATGTAAAAAPGPGFRAAAGQVAKGPASPDTTQALRARADSEIGSPLSAESKDAHSLGDNVELF